MIQNLNTFGLTLLLNSAVAWLIIRGIYYPLKRDKDYVLTFFAVNTLTFLIFSLLSSLDLSLGFGFSLFAIFSILRYRTDPIPIREMTYLFIMMALPVVNAVLVTQSNFTGLAIANLSIILVLFLVEKEWGFHYVSWKTIKYERIDLIKPEAYPLLIDDLRERTGLPITRCEIGKIDFMHDAAEIKIYYTEPSTLPEAKRIPGRPEPSRYAAAREQEWSLPTSRQQVSKY